MTEESHPKSSEASQEPEIEDSSFEPPPTGPDSKTNPAPLIDRPPFSGGDEEK